MIRNLYAVICTANFGTLVRQTLIYRYTARNVAPHQPLIMRRWAPPMRNLNMLAFIAERDRHLPSQDPFSAKILWPRLRSELPGRALPRRYIHDDIGQVPHEATHAVNCFSSFCRHSGTRLVHREMAWVRATTNTAEYIASQKSF
jgi:hypothetical protein